jgi:damage-control phosphatase, subfamily I
MQPMKIRPECRPCLESLVALTAGLATADPELQQRAKSAALDIITRDFNPEAISALIANRFHLAIQEIAGNPDPFAAPKVAQTAYLARMYRQIAPAYGSDLESLLSLAVAGNAIDFFRDEAEVTREFQAAPEFGILDLPQLRRDLEAAPGLMLYLADNAGEQFFDQPLLQQLRTRGWRVVYVVKGGAIQNDLTRNDLYVSGLGAACEPVADTGARTVGLDLAAVSASFRELWDAADLILAKGMGHFETMSHWGDPRVYFLLQAKCGPVAQALGVKEREYVLTRGSRICLDTAGEHDKKG